MNREETQFRLIEVDVSRGDEDRIVGLFRCDPVGSTKNGPQIVIIADIHSTLYVYERLLDTLTSTAEQARHLVSGVDQDPIGRFEKLVERLNQAVADFAKTEPSQLNWQRVNIFALELSSGHVCVTGVGTLMNLFLQKQEDGSMKGFDLLGSLDQPRHFDPEKPFAGLICGDMQPGDILMIGTGNFEREHSELRIRERLTNLPSVTAALEIRQDLEKRNVPGHHVAAILCAISARKPVIEEKPILPPTSTESIEKMRATEEDTETRLAPVSMPLPLSAKKWLEKITEQWEHGITSLRTRLTERRKTQPNDPETMKLASLRGMNAGYGSSFTSVQKKKAGIIGGGILTLVLIGLLVSHYRTVRAEQAAWDASLAHAADLRSRAESDSIFGNDERAQEEFADAAKTLQGLPQDSSDRKARVVALQSQLDDVRKRIQKIVPLSTVTELTLLPPGTKDESLRAPLLVGDSAYAINTNEATAIKVNLTTKSVKRIPLGDRANAVVSGSVGGTSLLYVTSVGTILTIAKSDDKVGDLTWTHTHSSSTVDATLYRNKLYALAPEQNQIWKTSQSGTGFGGESGYIKASSNNLQNAIRIAIGTDGTMNVLSNDGTVTRYLNGGQEGYSLSTVDPKLTSATDIWGSVDSPNIYIADPSNARLLAFDATGKLVAQYTNDAFKNPRQLFVDEPNKRILIIDGNRLLLVTFP